MIIIFWQRVQITFIIMATILAVGCSMGSRRGTALDHIKSNLQEAVIANEEIMEDEKPPAIVIDSLKPKIAMKVLGKSLEPPTSKFDVISTEVPAREFFLGLVEDTKVNLLVHPRVSGNISLNLKDVTINEVLEMIKKVYGYGVEVDGYNVRIFPAELQMRTFHLNYLDMQRIGSSLTTISSSGISGSGGGTSSGDTEEGTESSSSGGLNSEVNTTSSNNIWAQLQGTIEAMIGAEGGRRVAISPITGMVIVQAMPQELIKIEKFLKDSESFLSRQVILEAKILEVELGDGYRAGINWGLLSKSLNVSQLGGDLYGTTDELSATPVRTSGSLATAGNPQEVGFNNTAAPAVAQFAKPFGGLLALGLNYGNLSAFVELLSSQGNVQVLSNPRISTANNQKALIKVGTDEYFVTNITNTTTTGTATTTTPEVSLDAFFSGIALDVTPQISEDGIIILHIHPTVSTVSENNKVVTVGANDINLPLARSTIRESDTVIRAKDGQFVVIGGLMQDKTSEVTAGVPILKDIPYLGAAFRQTRQQSSKTELVILLRPMVVNDESWNNDISETYNRFDKLDLGFHVGANADLYGNLAETKEHVKYENN